MRLLKEQEHAKMFAAVNAATTAIVGAIGNPPESDMMINSAVYTLVRVARSYEVPLDDLLSGVKQTWELTARKRLNVSPDATWRKKLPGAGRARTVPRQIFTASNLTTGDC